MTSEKKNAAISSNVVNTNVNARPSGVDGRHWYITTFLLMWCCNSVGGVFFMAL